MQLKGFFWNVERDYGEGPRNDAITERFGRL